jgi:hypothetical protein
MWLLYALLRTSLPVPVTLNRFAAALFVSGVKTDDDCSSVEKEK